MIKYVMIVIAVFGLILLGTELIGNQKESTLLESYGFDELNIAELIDNLENETYGSEVQASIGRDALALNLEGEAYTFSIPNDFFYISFGPYINSTHECYTHSLTGCQGELANEDMLVKIYDINGNLIQEKTMNTGDDGFIGLYLDRNTEYTIQVSYEGLNSSFKADTSGDQTCFTEERLS
ncbi:CueP family metal-binding protein [Mycoplasmatota bacterium]|nr:CueP family metal-binding protein [Mycoplasmatota bacterium]